MPILVIGLLVFIHELGHFLVAKWCGVGVVRFSVGFGPALLRFRIKETVYQVSAIPLGGYVRMVGDMPDMLTGEQASDAAVRGEEGDEEPEDTTPELKAVLEDRNRWFVNKNFWQRSAIVFAGPLFNFILSFVLIFLVALAYGEGKLEKSATIGNVMKGSPAAQAGLEADDVVLAIGEKDVATWEELALTIHESSGEPLLLRVKRDGTELELSVTPQQKDLRLPTGESQKAYVVGIGPKFHHIDVGPLRAVSLGAIWTYEHTVLTYKGLWGMLTGNVSPNDLAGPLFILDMAGEQSAEGLDRLLRFTALLSVSLAVLNLLPIPILDGGHLMFFIIEALLGPISVRKKEFAQGVGMLLLISLMVFALSNDITRDPNSFKADVSWDGESEQGEAKENGATP